MSDYTVYIDESGDLGINRGTRWFVLTAVIVDKDDEPSIRNTLSNIKTRLNLNCIHFCKIDNYYKRAFIVDGLNKERFTYVNVIVDTSKLKKDQCDSNILYNFSCRMLLERVSWYLRDIGKTADIILSARGTSRDSELVTYIKEKLIPYSENQIAEGVFNSVYAKQAGSWDLLQLADVCATSMFYSHQQNGWGYVTPCYSCVLQDHLYKYNNRVKPYGIKYYNTSMEPKKDELECYWVCTKKERTPGTTTT